MDKTIVVQVETWKLHPRYKKVIRSATKFHAHDEQNQANVGDVVRIVETRPLSKTKNWRLAEIMEAAKRASRQQLRRFWNAIRVTGRSHVIQQETRVRRGRTTRCPRAPLYPRDGDRTADTPASATSSSVPSRRRLQGDQEGRGRARWSCGRASRTAVTTAP